MEETGEEDWFDPSPFIENSCMLTEAIGFWPIFDDAAVLSLELDRSDGSPWSWIAPTAPHGNRAVIHRPSTSLFVWRKPNICSPSSNSRMWRIYSCRTSVIRMKSWKSCSTEYQKNGTRKGSFGQRNYWSRSSLIADCRRSLNANPQLFFPLSRAMRKESFQASDQSKYARGRHVQLKTLALERRPHALPGCFQIFRQNARFADCRHEVGVAGPARQRMEMQVPRNARTAGFANI